MSEADRKVYEEVSYATQELYDKTTGLPLEGVALENATRRLKEALERSKAPVTPKEP
jgi:hypothetical protein